MAAADIAAQLATYDATPVTSTDALNTALGQYGVPEIRNTVSGLRTTIANTTNALNAVDPSVTGRTGGSLVTEAQRAAIVNNERAPIAQNLTDETGALSQNQQDLTDALGAATTDATNKVNDYNAGRANLESEYQDADKSEQDAAANQLAEQQLAASATKAAAVPAATTAAATKAAAVGHITQQLDSLKGGDGKVSEETWNGALNDAVAAGFTPEQFWQQYGQYVNKQYANTYAGYVSGYGGKYTS